VARQVGKLEGPWTMNNTCFVWL